MNKFTKSSFSSLDFKLLNSIFNFNKLIKKKGFSSIDIQYLKKAKKHFEEKNKGFALFLAHYIRRRKMIKASSIRLQKSEPEEVLISFQDLQSGYRSNKISPLTQRFVSAEQHFAFIEKVTNCRKIQSIFRSFFFRKNFYNKLRSELNAKVIQSVIKIQNFLRGRYVMKKVKTFLIIRSISNMRKKNAMTIQKFLYNFYSTNEMKREALINLINETRKSSIIKIQKYFRMKKMRRRVKELLRKMNTHYVLTYPFFARTVQLKVHIFMNDTFRFSVKTFSYKYDPLLEMFILFIDVSEFPQGKYRCQLIVDNCVTCDGRFPHIEFTDGKFYNLIKFSKKGFISHNNSEEDVSSGDDFEVFTGESGHAKKRKETERQQQIKSSTESSYEELRTNLDCKNYKNLKDVIQNQSFEELAKFNYK